MAQFFKRKILKQKETLKEISYMSVNNKNTFTIVFADGTIMNLTPSEWREILRYLKHFG